VLKKGDVELAIAADLGEHWERLDRWPLFSEEFGLILSARHRLASHSVVEIDDLRQERWLRRAYCEQGDKLASLIRSHSLDVEHGHELSSEQDLITLLESDFGVAFAPRTMPRPETLKQAAVNGVELRRTVYLYGVAGRQRTAVASAILKMLRAADWTRYSS
jgi:DNA-binding transcriptional LysR family regulator